MVYRNETDNTKLKLSLLYFQIYQFFSFKKLPSLHFCELIWEISETFASKKLIFFSEFQVLKIESFFKKFQKFGQSMGKNA